uniref:VDE domain-containing protein n=1 Tax=Globodera pallida TaxID=36090 RepID=A0A183BN19_GLOPA
MNLLIALTAFAAPGGAHSWVITPSGVVTHVDWTWYYKALRLKVGFSFPGYMIHESGQWSDVHEKWFFMPRMDNFTHMEPWVFLKDGPGNVTKGFKGEWMTVRENKLYVGGLGKEWTTPNGDLLNYNPMYVKVITPSGVVTHVDWTWYYKALRLKVGFSFPGYMIHESGQWSDVHEKWFFMPRSQTKN